jgi:hypothetical protein
MAAEMASAAAAPAAAVRMAAAMRAASSVPLRRIGGRGECDWGAGDRQRERTHQEQAAERTIFHGNCLDKRQRGDGFADRSAASSHGERAAVLIWINRGRIFLEYAPEGRAHRRRWRNPGRERRLSGRPERRVAAQIT